MFIHTLANTFINFLEEIILHEPDIEEVDDYADQIAIFVHSGIEELYARQTSGRFRNEYCEFFHS
jgi:hypothetical protein